MDKKLTKGITLSTANIDAVIKSFKKKCGMPQQGILIPEWYPTDEIDRTKYRGKGRPRKDDYVYEHYTEMLNDSLLSMLSK